MTEPLNFTPKALAALRDYAVNGSPASRPGLAYLADKLALAQVFVLPDAGELLDRSKPRPEVPGVMFKPPFPVVALEYTAVAPHRQVDVYTAAKSSRRIALAWDWQGDLPRQLSDCLPPNGLPPGVAVASLAFMDDIQRWLPVFGGFHFAYDGAWESPENWTGFAQAMVEAGQVSTASINARRIMPSPFALLPDAAQGIAHKLGSVAGMFDYLSADMHDEANAYIDLCYALGCGNVKTARHTASDRLNRRRLAAGKLPLTDFHTLVLAGNDQDGALHGIGGDGVRAHLRRGHIRRLRYLGPDRITWVNAAMVRGSVPGFVGKQYAVRAGR